MITTRTSDTTKRYGVSRDQRWRHFHGRKGNRAGSPQHRRVWRVSSSNHPNVNDGRTFHAVPLRVIVQGDELRLRVRYSWLAIQERRKWTTKFVPRNSRFSADCKPWISGRALIIRRWRVVRSRTTVTGRGMTEYLHRRLRLWI